MESIFMQEKYLNNFLIPISKCINSSLSYINLIIKVHSTRFIQKYSIFIII